MSKSTYKIVFTKKYNIGFHLPKKDKCNLCSKLDNIKISRDLNEEAKIKSSKGRGRLSGNVFI